MWMVGLLIQTLCPCYNFKLFFFHEMRLSFEFLSISILIGMNEQECTLH